MVRTLFVAGAPRNGNIALADYLEQIEEVMVCHERYGCGGKIHHVRSAISRRIVRQ